MRDNRNDYSLWVERPEGRRQLGRSRRRWEGNLKMILKKWDGAKAGLI
jgi:hypothetical protein